MATALYRRYRPETFAQVIGQEHVTGPLMAALRAGRANHAYLFSGPRGCGKTTSARILARCLNCAQGPTDTPCGVCDSCVELARGGPGSLDVVEIDAASHGGVDDARELRERAAFSPARDRFKIYIIDEAHMVTPQGFNALLKIVEEPPDHVMFVFATTEPDKVLGTIRSRTHHYPFHLVPPQVLLAYLQQVCDTEGVPVGKGVLPLVVRAGAGSVRDSLSVLDQLAAGAGSEGIDYEHAVALLGFTHATLLDDVVSAFAAGDGATVFRVVDRVISSGQDPRRFVDDLLQRLRDLVVVQAVAERAHEVFPGVPDDQLERMAVQAAAFGASALSRSADLANAASTEMTGATSPRLHLELLCARMLLPAADDGERGLGARLDRLERRLSVPLPTGASAGPALSSPALPSPAGPPSPLTPAALVTESPPGVQVPPVQVPPAQVPPAQVPDQLVAPPSATEPAVPERVEPQGAPVDAPGVADSTEAVRRMWPEILDHLASTKRRTWTRISQDAQVHAVDDRQLVLWFRRVNTMAAFNAGPHADAVRESLIAVLGLDRQVVAVAGDAGPPAPPAPTPTPAVVAASSPPVALPAPLPSGAAPATPARPPTSPSTGEPAHGPGRDPSAAERQGSEPAVPPRSSRPERLPAPPDFPPEPTDDDLYPPEEPWGVAEAGVPTPAAAPGPAPTSPRAEGQSAASAAPPRAPADLAPPPPEPAPVPAPVPVAAPQAPQAPQAPLRGADLVRSAVRSASAAGTSRTAPPGHAPGSAPPVSSPPGSLGPVDDEPSYDDADAEGSALTGAAVAEQLLGGRILSIEERR